MNPLDSYRVRVPGQNCICYGTPNEPCWGAVHGSSRGLVCLGHEQGPGTYLSPEDVENIRIKHIQQEAERIFADLEKEKQEKADWEAKRWFRPLIAKATERTPFYQSLSDQLLWFVFSMIGEGYIFCSPEYGPDLQEMSLPVIAEVKARGAEWPEGAYDLDLGDITEDDLKFDVKALSDQHLLLWYGCAGQVIDYSCLDRGVRKAVFHVYDVTSKELKVRGLEGHWLI